MTCDRCGQPLPARPHTGPSGYGLVKHTDATTKVVTEQQWCYSCCANRERATMIETGRALLYLTVGEGGRTLITSWTGNLIYPVKTQWKGGHNWPNLVPFVTFVRFVGPDGKVWSGRHAGEWNDVVHCKRTKLRSV